ncbi:hypothetical protein GBAR_LOCUS12893 [Geodia barretti]|uniref:Uncharacterized protein n=1 Tax=Geodia barretti TaxID=519541 RepID=A0AA35S1U8_GEOBA|nr:hypothetical protein GBAR_LOCUS12893 [Geodia barretti]
MSSSKGYQGTGTQADLKNHGEQCNPNNSKYEGHEKGYTGTGTKSDLNNHADQRNPNNSKYTPTGGK